MSDLTDEAIATHLSWLGPDPLGMDGAALVSALKELQRHRAMVRRLEEFCLELRSDSVIMGGHVTIGDRQIDGGITRYIATELRRRMRAP